MKSITLLELRRQVSQRADTERTRKNLRMLNKYCKGWGSHVTIYQDIEMRKLEANSIARRMALSYSFVKGRLDSFNLITDWSLV